MGRKFTSIHILNSNMDVVRFMSKMKPLEVAFYVIENKGNVSVFSEYLISQTLKEKLKEWFAGFNKYVRRMMRKKMGVLFLVAVIMLTACIPKGLRGLVTTDEAKADERMKQIMEVMKNKDKEGLKALFSKQALKDAKDFDDNMDSLFAFF